MNFFIIVIFDNLYLIINVTLSNNNYSKIISELSLSDAESVGCYQSAI